MLLSSETASVLPFLVSVIPTHHIVKVVLIVVSFSFTFLLNFVISPVSLPETPQHKERELFFCQRSGYRLLAKQRHKRVGFVTLLLNFKGAQVWILAVFNVARREAAVKRIQFVIEECFQNRQRAGFETFIYSRPHPQDHTEWRGHDVNLVLAQTVGVEGVNHQLLKSNVVLGFYWTHHTCPGLPIYIAELLRKTYAE